MIDIADQKSALLELSSSLDEVVGVPIDEWIGDIQSCAVAMSDWLYTAESWLREQGVWDQTAKMRKLILRIEIERATIQDIRAFNCEHTAWIDLFDGLLERWESDNADEIYEAENP